MKIPWKERTTQKSKTLKYQAFGRNTRLKWRYEKMIKVLFIYGRIFAARLAESVITHKAPRPCPQFWNRQLRHQPRGDRQSAALRTVNKLRESTFRSCRITQSRLHGRITARRLHHRHGYANIRNLNRMLKMIRMERFTNFFPSPVPAAILRIRSIREILRRRTAMSWGCNGFLAHLAPKEIWKQKRQNKASAHLQRMRHWPFTIRKSYSHSKISN